jgi:putative acetyltransferase
MTEIVHATAAEHIAAVRELWNSYWKEIGFTPCFQNFDREMADLPGKYGPPAGCLLVAVVNGQVAGAVAFRGLDAEACEAKRLYVAAAHRGGGIARALMERIVEEARSAGYRRMVGDAMPVMTQALAMYDRMGFRRIDGYRGSTEGAICIEYTLQDGENISPRMNTNKHE